MLLAERDALEAGAKVLQTLNQELRHYQTTAEQSLAEAQARPDFQVLRSKSTDRSGARELQLRSPPNIQQNPHAS